MAKFFSKNRKISLQIYTTPTQTSQIFPKYLKRIWEIYKFENSFEKRTKIFWEINPSGRRPKSGATFFPPSWYLAGTYWIYPPDTRQASKEFVFLMAAQLYKNGPFSHKNIPIAIMCFVRVPLNTQQKFGHKNQLCLGNKLEINVQIWQYLSM